MATYATDGSITHDASFQAVDEHKARMETIRGTELGFVDSYKYNIAAYRLAELLGIDDMMPVYVERHWGGNPGSLSWWLPVKMDEVERHKQKLTAPDPDAWNSECIGGGFSTSWCTNRRQFDERSNWGGLEDLEG